MKLLPPEPLLRDLVRTTLWIWVGLHVAFALGGGGAGALSPLVGSLLLAIVVMLAHLDRASRGLALLLANLGYSSRRIGLLVLVVAGVAEAALQTAVRLVG